MDHDELKNAAEKAADFSYAPYSQFHVGAAVLSADGKIFSGCNVENRSYGLTICAEQSAVTAAVSAGKKTFSAIAVFCRDSELPVPPCGACRQVLSEFCSSDVPVFFAGKEKIYEKTTIGELYPLDSLHNLKK